MPVELLSFGSYSITNNNIRALPSAGSHIFVTPSTATSIDISNDPTMANAKNLTPAAGAPFIDAGMDVGAGFIRVNGGAAIIRVTRI